MMLGAFMRLVWLEDMEWKGDERLMYHVSQKVPITGEWPTLGMPSGAGGIPNPGLSMWVFVAAGHFFTDPVKITRVVAILNIIALLALFLLILFRVAPKQKEIWYWGLAFACVSPMAILFSRKLWANDLLPFFAIFVIIGSAYRHKRCGALLWGVAGALVGQIHMSGFYYALALFLFTVFYERLASPPQKTRWFYWFMGSMLGSITLIPWAHHLLTSSHETVSKLEHVFEFSFYKYWFLDPLGIRMKYSFKSFFPVFMSYPLIGKTPTYLVGVLHLFLMGTGIYGLKLLVPKMRRILNDIRSGVYLQNLSLADFYIIALLVLMGGIMTLSGVGIQEHYLIVVFPFTFIWLAKVFYPRRGILASILLSQLIISACFLSYVHTNHGVMGGNYGESYQSQKDRGSEMNTLYDDVH